MDLSMVSGGNTDCKINMDYRYHHNPQKDHRPQTSTWLLEQHKPQTVVWSPVAAWPMDINIASGSSMDQASTWPSVVTSLMSLVTTDINMASSRRTDGRHSQPSAAGWPMVLNRASGSIGDHRHHQSPRCQHKPWTSAWPLVVTWPTVNYHTWPVTSILKTVSQRDGNEPNVYWEKTMLSQLWFISMIESLKRNANS